MGRVYTAAFGGVTMAAIQDIFEVVAPSDAIVILHKITLFQITLEGDAEENQLRLQFTFGHTSSGSSGGTITARPNERGTAAFGGTVERNNTSQATGGSPVTPEEDGWNIRVPYLWVPTPGIRHVLSPGERFVLELPVAPIAAFSGGGSITIEEVGG